MKTALLSLLMLAGLSAFAQTCYIISGESQSTEFTPNVALGEPIPGLTPSFRAERICKNWIEEDSWVFEIEVRRYFPDSTWRQQSLWTTMTFVRAEKYKDWWQCISVSEILTDVGKHNDALIVNHWPPERCREIQRASGLNFVGTRRIFEPLRRTILNGTHVWMIKDVPTAPWEMPVYFRVVGNPKVGPTFCSFEYKLMTAGGEFLAPHDPDSAWACRFKIYGAAYGHR